MERMASRLGATACSLELRECSQDAQEQSVKSAIDQGLIDGVQGSVGGRVRKGWILHQRGTIPCPSKYAAF